jgi:hypothetical protein
MGVKYLIYTLYKYSVQNITKAQICYKEITKHVFIWRKIRESWFIL